MTDANHAMSPIRSQPSGPAPRDAHDDWRERRLVAAGFAEALASELARDAAVDLHAVLVLRDRGCAPELAARILAPLDAALPEPERAP
jgi:hypothetical protein